MGLGRDFDTSVYGQSDGLAGIEHRLYLTDFTFLEALPKRRPFLAKIRNGFRTLTQISNIRVHIILEMRNPVTDNIQ